VSNGQHLQEQSQARLLKIERGIPYRSYVRIYSLIFGVGGTLALISRRKLRSYCCVYKIVLPLIG